MMAHTHSYSAKITWTGAAQGPTASYQSYSREYLVEIPGKPALRGSADATFRGDPALHNPEDLLVVALSTCHMLSYFAGTMAMKDKKIRFTEAVLHPRVTISADSDADKAAALHEQAHEQCFIASSVNFPVRHDAVVTRAAAG
jgi:organic hydroperoxide reductase OsmC/OhrA